MTFFFSAKHRFPAFELDVAFEAPGRGITALFGPSGSGKSTVLAIAAGLLRPSECRIGINGAVQADSTSGLWVAAERRQIGLVFQESRLFPHMSVRANLRYGLARRHERPIGFDTVVDLLVTADGVRRWSDKRVATASTHGTGCTLASAIATGLAQGLAIADAVDRARRYVRAAILAAPGLGHGHGPLGHGHAVGRFD